MKTIRSLLFVAVLLGGCGTTPLFEGGAQGALPPGAIATGATPTQDGGQGQGQGQGVGGVAATPDAGMPPANDGGLPVDGGQPMPPADAGAPADGGTCDAVAGTYRVTAKTECGPAIGSSIEIREQACTLIFPGAEIEGPAFATGETSWRGTLRVGEALWPCDVWRTEGTTDSLEIACGSTCWVQLNREGAEVPPDETQRVLDAVRLEHLEELHGMVGQYALGESPVYTGTFWARDNKGTLDFHEDESFSGAVIAALRSEEVWLREGRGPGHTLTVVDPSQRMRVRFSQWTSQPYRTWASLVTKHNTSYGVTGSCMTCLVGLEAMPTDIRVENLVALGEYGGRQPLRVEASGSLSKLAPSALTFADIAALNGHYGQPYRVIEEFEQRDAEMVRPLERELLEPAAVPEGAEFEECNQVTTYRAEQYVSLTDLTRYGIRALEIVSSQTCCFNPSEGEACIPGVRECF